MNNYPSFAPEKNIYKLTSLNRQSLYNSETKGQIDVILSQLKSGPMIIPKTKFERKVRNEGVHFGKEFVELSWNDPVALDSLPSCIWIVTDS